MPVCPGGRFRGTADRSVGRSTVSQESVEEGHHQAVGHQQHQPRRSIVDTRALGSCYIHHLE